ncbi:MAG: hypothetical protein ACYC1D_05715 [Acidimicrobiales bacterium]
MSAQAELSSLATLLDDLVNRVAALTGDLSGPERDALGSELLEVERSLRAAQRRMAKALQNTR